MFEWATGAAWIFARTPDATANPTVGAEYPAVYDESTLMLTHTGVSECFS